MFILKCEFLQPEISIMYIYCNVYTYATHIPAAWLPKLIQFVFFLLGLGG